MEIKPFETASLGIAKFVVNDLELIDGEPKETKKTYHLVIDFPALAFALEKTGLDFASPAAWDDLTPQNLLSLCWSAFQRFYPEIEEVKVGRMLSPADRWKVRDMLLELAFPGTMELAQKEMDKRAAEAASQGAQPGEGEPAAGSVAS